MMTRRSLITRGGAFVVTVGVAGCLSDSEDESGGEFQFERVVFSDENPGKYDSYEAVPERTTFVVDDRLWLLVVVRNAPTDDGTASLTYTFRTVTPGGTTWEPVVEREEEWENVEATDRLVVWERFSTYPEDTPGEYETEVTVEDIVGGEQLRTAETFELERGG
ncbi:hypothetical protein [Salinibaculum salinum]|uniref:hypothetical protein n=1 Tax=Salinibaculum salinum TaxID=3131996 RepID=UPI0030EDB972